MSAIGLLVFSLILSVSFHLAILFFQLSSVLCVICSVGPDEDGGGQI